MSLIETTKTVYDLAKKGATVELQEQVMQLREEALELQEENLELRKENLNLKKKIESQESLKFERKVYFRDGDKVPFCPYCYDRHRRLIHLTGPPEEGPTTELQYTCQECRIVYREEVCGEFVVVNARSRTE